MILENTDEYKIMSLHLFIDFKSAYDRVNQQEVYQALYDLNFHSKLNNWFVKMTMKDTKCMVQIGSDMS